MRHWYWYDGGWVWMLVNAIFWFALLAVIVWAVLQVVRRVGDHGRPHRETPQEILDRRFASGEIDADTYTEARERLAGRTPGGPPAG